MSNNPHLHSPLSRLAHALLALVLFLLLARAVWSSLARVLDDAHARTHFAAPPPPRVETEAKGKGVDEGRRVQDIAQSFNTFWNSWDPDHCRNICIASKRACELWDCVRVPGVKQWD